MAGKRIRDEGERTDYLKNCTLMDDEYMRRFFADSPACVQATVRALLDMPDLVVEDFAVQKDAGFIGARSVVLDVFATDSEGTAYNIEVQRDLSRATPRRARFHASLVDAGLMPERGDFNDLPDCYVVFVTYGDALGRGKSLYWFERADRDGGGALGDGSHIIFVDAAYNAYPEGPLADVMHDFVCPDPSAMRVPEFARRARALKGPQKKEKEPADMKFVTDILLDEGRQEGKAEMIARFVEDGRLSREDIASICRMTLPQVEEYLELARELEEDEEEQEPTAQAC